MKYLLILVLGAIVVSGCDSTPGRDGKGTEDEIDFSGLWTTTGHNPDLEIDVAAESYRATWPDFWSLHSNCRGAASGMLTSVGDSGVVLQGFRVLPLQYYRPESELLSYRADDDVLVSEMRLLASGEVSSFVYERTDTFSVSYLAPCDELRSRYTGDWELSSMSDSTGDVLADWQTLYPSWIVHIDFFGRGNHVIEAADGTEYTYYVDMLFSDDYSVGSFWLVSPFPYPMSKIGILAEVVDDGLELSFFGNEDLWSQAFGTSLDGSTRFTFTRQ